MGCPGGTGADGAGVNLSGSFRNMIDARQGRGLQAALLERSRQNPGNVLPQGNHFVAGDGAGVVCRRWVCREAEQVLGNRGLGRPLHLSFQILYHGEPSMWRK